MSERILIARKLTDIEYRMRDSGATFEEIAKQIPDSDEDGQRSLASHLRQMRDFKSITSYLRNPGEFVVGENLTRDLVKKHKDVLSYGGDDYGKYVSHYLDNERLVIINSDPLTSNGALTEFDAESFAPTAELMNMGGDLPFEEWTRLQASIDGKPVPERGMSEIFFGDEIRWRTSRYVLEYRGEKERLSNSGLLVVPGAGTTGWFHSAASCKHEEAETFPRTEKKARFYTTEAFYSRLMNRFTREGDIEPGEELSLTYTAHRTGFVVVDALAVYPLLRGHRATVKISDSPLKVVKRV